MSKLKTNPIIVSIIIPSFNSKDYLKICLKSIFENTKINFEVIVVEGGSNDDTVKFIKSKFKDKNELIIINLNKNTGPSAKRNTGIKKARGKYLVFLDSDTIVDKNWLDENINLLEKNPQFAGGQIKLLKMDQKDRFDTAGEKITSLGFLSERARSSKDHGQFDQVEPIFSGKTAAMIFKKEIVEKAGLFDSDYFIFWEEPDLCWRIWKLGYKVVYLPFGRVWHDFNQKKPTTSWLNQLTFYGCRNQIMTSAKNAVGLIRLKFLTAAIISWLGILLLYIIKLDLAKAKKIIAAFIWLTKNQQQILKKRNKLKKIFGKKFYSDPDWLPQITTNRSPFWYLGKGVNYVLQKPF